MPNWCSTSLRIEDNNTEELDKFAELFGQWISKDWLENGFGHNWLGNVVIGSEIATTEDVEQCRIRCRGSVSDWDYDGNAMQIWTETAWTPMLKMWVMLQEKYFPNGSIEFFAEEPGCEIYVTNDPNYEGAWYIDAWDNRCAEKYADNEASDETVIALLQEVLSTSEEDLDVLLKMYEESDIEGFSVHKWEVVDINDWLD